MERIVLPDSVQAVALSCITAEVKEELAAKFDALADRCKWAADRFDDLAAWVRRSKGRPSRPLQEVFRLALTDRVGGIPLDVEDFERIAGEDAEFVRVKNGRWRQSGGLWVPDRRGDDRPEGQKRRPPAENGRAGKGGKRPPDWLREIRKVAACPYKVDAKRNTISSLANGKTYSISRGAASRAVNRLVRGMVACLRKERDSWFVTFTRQDERAFHKNNDMCRNAAFYSDCIERIGQKGAGNQKYGNLVRLRG